MALVLAGAVGFVAGLVVVGLVAAAAAVMANRDLWEGK